MSSGGSDAVAARYLAPVLRRVIGGVAKVELVFFDAVGAFSGCEFDDDRSHSTPLARASRSLSRSA